MPSDRYSRSRRSKAGKGLPDRRSISRPDADLMANVTERRRSITPNTRIPQLPDESWEKRFTPPRERTPDEWREIGKKYSAPNSSAASSSSDLNAPLAQSRSSTPMSRLDLTRSYNSLNEAMNDSVTSLRSAASPAVPALRLDTSVGGPIFSLQSPQSATSTTSVDSFRSNSSGTGKHRRRSLDRLARRLSISASRSVNWDMDYVPPVVAPYESVSDPTSPSGSAGQRRYSVSSLNDSRASLALVSPQLPGEDSPSPSPMTSEIPTRRSRSQFALDQLTEGSEPDSNALDRSGTLASWKKTQRKSRPHFNPSAASLQIPPRSSTHNVSSRHAKIQRPITDDSDFAVTEFEDNDGIGHNTPGQPESPRTGDSFKTPSSPTGISFPQSPRQSSASASGRSSLGLPASPKALKHVGDMGLVEKKAKSPFAGYVTQSSTSSQNTQPGHGSIQGLLPDTDQLASSRSRAGTEFAMSMPDPYSTRPDSDDRTPLRLPRFHKDTYEMLTGESASLENPPRSLKVNEPSPSSGIGHSDDSLRNVHEASSTSQTRSEPRGSHRKLRKKAGRDRS
ncbi:hypothetical protein IAR55_002070 [Kwoniella newhampshirensis]|uniref:Uncharacterized protein n=1 Tax=Kwoniella newhampshirensis TaxID=1651941 RepID=A0AAW0Z0I9_9TREE